jgi:oligopeptide transport system substrate-binding protein
MTHARTITRVTLTLIIALLATAAVACGGSGHQSSGKLAPNQQFRVRIAGDPSTLDPQLATFADDISVVKQLYRGLFTYDKNLKVVPAIAKEMPTQDNGGISKDALTYTIKLRSDATWSDGTPVTAADFVYAFQRLFDPSAGAQGYYFSFYTAIDGAEAASSGKGSPEQIGVSAPDNQTLVIKLAHPQPTLPTLLALWPASPLRKDLIAQYGASWTGAGKLVTDGPFVLKDYKQGDSIVLDANTKYWGDDKPTLQELVYRIIPDDSAALVAYQNGEIDMTAVPGPDTERFANNPEDVRTGKLETYAIQYNTKQAPFDNALVRQAFSRAIDRDAYVTALLHGIGQPALGWLPPDMPGGDKTVGANLGFDANAARSLLSQAGYKDGKGFPTVTLTIADVQQNRLTAEFLQQQLKQNLGIDLKIETVEEANFYQRYQQSDFQLTWASWFADYADPENWLPQQFATKGGFNVFGYSNSKVDDLFQQAAAELDQSKRLALYDQAQKIIIADQAITPIYHSENNYLLKRSVGGLTPTALDAEPGDWFVSSIQIIEGAAPPASRPGYK